MTAQAHEVLIYDGNETSMAFCPPLPEGCPRIKELSDEQVKGTESASIVFSTCCWREYIGTWELKDGRLSLVGLEGRYRLDGNEPLFADWFTGILRVPKGKRLHYVHMGFRSIYEEEMLIEVVKGIVVKTETIDHRGMKFPEIDPDFIHPIERATYLQLKEMQNDPNIP